MGGPAVAFLIGVVLIWVVANGKAGDVWTAVTGPNKPAQRPADPSTSQPGSGTIPPGSTVYTPPNSSTG